jgi:hypothetical protein
LNKRTDKIISGRAVKALPKNDSTAKIMDLIDDNENSKEKLKAIQTVNVSKDEAKAILNKEEEEFHNLYLSKY